jgi:hypothetical protein
VTTAGALLTTIAARAVTFGKVVAIATARLLGRTAVGSGDVEELDASTAKTLLALDNVENKSSSTIRGEITSTNVTDALTFTPVSTARTVSAGAGLAGGGDLSANRTLTLDLASTNVWTASQTFRAGSTAAGSAPIKLQSGALMTAPEVGAVEFLSDKVYFTVTSGAARKEFALVDVTGQLAIGSLTLTHGTITTDVNTLGATVTWNAADVTFTAQKINVTDTASAAGSLLADWQFSGVSYINLRKGEARVYRGTDVNEYASYFGNKASLYSYGNLAAEMGSYGFQLRNTGTIGWSNSGSQADNPPFTYLGRDDAAYTLALQNGANAQTFRVYGTYTDSGNYVRASLSSSTTAITLAAETAGTGADDIDLNLTPAGGGAVRTSSEIFALSFFARNDCGLLSTSAGSSNQGLVFASSLGVQWSEDAYRWGTKDIGLYRSAAGVLAINSGNGGSLRDLTLRNVVGQTGYTEMSEMTAPAAPAANGCRIYAVDNGAGKTQLMAIFSSGAAQQLAIQP